MNIILKVAIALAAVIMLTFSGASAASAAPQITFDADGSSLPVAAAAQDWSKNTGVTVVAGECTTGSTCVHFKVVDLACGLSNPGCAYGLPDGSCQVEVARGPLTWPGREYLDDLITKHEGGHCIFRTGGFTGHLADERALMSATQPSSPTRREATLTSIDRAFTRSLFS